LSLPAIAWISQGHGSMSIAMPLRNATYRLDCPYYRRYPPDYPHFTTTPLSHPTSVAATATSACTPPYDDRASSNIHTIDSSHASSLAFAVDQSSNVSSSQTALRTISPKPVEDATSYNYLVAAGCEQVMGCFYEPNTGAQLGYNTTMPIAAAQNVDFSTTPLLGSSRTDPSTPLASPSSALSLPPLFPSRDGLYVVQSSNFGPPSNSYSGSCHGVQLRSTPYPQQQPVGIDTARDEVYITSHRTPCLHCSYLMSGSKPAGRSSSEDFSDLHSLSAPGSIPLVDPVS
jgi:hypothetical protein